PQQTTALTSMWPARWGISSWRNPVRMLTTPAGTSPAAHTSPNVMELSGFRSAATVTQVLPPTMIGAIAATTPNKAPSAGASTATTPVGSGTLKTKCGDPTGFTVLKSCTYLSPQPA